MWCKEQDKKNLQEQLSGEDRGNLPEKEFRVMLIKMIQDLRKIVEAHIKIVQEWLTKTKEN